MLNYDLDTIADTISRAIQSNNVPVMQRMKNQVRAMGMGLQPVDRKRAQQLVLLIDKKLAALEATKKRKPKKVEGPSGSSAVAG
jgi:hypothetical protein